MYGKFSNYRLPEQIASSLRISRDSRGSINWNLRDGLLRRCAPRNDSNCPINWNCRNGLLRRCAPRNDSNCPINWNCRNGLLRRCAPRNDSNCPINWNCRNGMLRRCAFRETVVVRVVGIHGQECFVASHFARQSLFDELEFTHRIASSSRMRGTPRNDGSKDVTSWFGHCEERSNEAIRYE